jgi:DNA topoisomerase-2
VINQVTEKLREYFKKKKKVDVKPGDIRAHMRIYISASVNRPKFSSQTKENMISPPSEWKTSYKVSDKVVAKILTSPIIQSVLDWIEAKEEAARKAREREMNKDAKKFDPRRVEKFSDANERHERNKCILFLTEGDSAAKAIQSCADKRWMGTYPLKGKPLNVCDIDIERLAKNEVFQAFLKITGLQLGEKITDVKQLRFGKICFMTDQDLDGFHITGLLLNMIRTYWPELLDMGVIYRFQTPLLKAFTKAGPVEFFDEADFVKWEAKNKDTKYTKKYYKGLGTSTTKEFTEYVQNLDRYLVPLTIVDEADYDSIDLAFNRGRAEDRKAWLDLKAAA